MLDNRAYVYLCGERAARERRRHRPGPVVGHEQTDDLVGREHLTGRHGRARARPRDRFGHRLGRARPGASEHELLVAAALSTPAQLGGEPPAALAGSLDVLLGPLVALDL